MVPLQLDPDALRCVETALAGAGLSFMSLGRKWQGLYRRLDLVTSDLVSAERLRWSSSAIQYPKGRKTGRNRQGRGGVLGAMESKRRDRSREQHACIPATRVLSRIHTHPHLLCLPTENSPGTVGRVQRQHLHAMAAEHARAEAGRTEASAGRGAAGTLAGLRGRVRPGGVPCVGTLQ